METTLVHILDNFSDHGRDTAYIQYRGYRKERWSYGRVAETARQFARELQARNILPNDRIVIRGENCAEWVAAFLGAVSYGVVVVPLDCTASADFIGKVCDQVDPRLILSSRNACEINSDAATIFMENLAQIVFTRSKEPALFSRIRGSQTAEIVFTSGTTSDPKGVVITHTNIISNLQPLESEIRRYLKYEKIVHPLRFMNILPLSHMFGQYLGLFIPQILGATVVFQHSMNPTDIVHSIRREKVSVLVAVPRVLDSLKKNMEREVKNRGETAMFRNKLEKGSKIHFLKRWWLFRHVHLNFGWKFWAFICGGAQLSETTERFWNALGFAVIQGYGLTETTSLISVNHPFKVGSGTVGRILPGREVRLSETGEILVRGGSIAKSYTHDKTITPVSDEEGWFSTGDLGMLDEDGNLHFKGRKKNVIVSSEGMNIYPEDLQSALMTQPEVRDCIVVGVDRGGKTEACAVLLVEGNGRSTNKIIQSANDSLAEYQHIRYWCVWPDEDFPRTSTQKPRIGVIQDFANTYFKNTRASQQNEGIVPSLIRQIAGSRIDTIHRNSTLSRDLDLSSIERVELLGALEERFQIDLDENSFTEASTVEDLEAMIQKPRRPLSRYSYPGWTQRKGISILRNTFHYLVVLPLTYFMAQPLVYGRKNLERLNCPALFVSNHVTQVDAVFILAALPARKRHRLAIAMMGELLEEMRNPGPGKSRFYRCICRIKYWLVTALFNVFPLPQMTGFRESFRFAGESADRGYSILVFPEGGRTKDGNMADFRAGIGILAQNLGVPVVPMRIDGLYEMKRKGKRVARAGEVSVRIGPPIRYGFELSPAEIAEDLQMRCMGL